MPSSPIRQTCSNTVGPSPVRCSVNRMEYRLALPSSLASRRLRSISGRPRRSLPSCSIRSKANSTASWPRRRLRSAWKSGVRSSRDRAPSNSKEEHEAIFRRWGKLRDWIAAEREFLAWRTGLEAARRAWQATPNSLKSDALLMGAGLTQAQS